MKDYFSRDFSILRDTYILTSYLSHAENLTSKNLSRLEQLYFRNEALRENTLAPKKWNENRASGNWNGAFPRPRQAINARFIPSRHRLQL